MDSKTKRSLRTIVCWLHIAFQGLLFIYIYFVLGSEIHSLTEQSADVLLNIKIIIHIGTSFTLFAMNYSLLKLLSTRHKSY